MNDFKASKAQKAFEKKKKKAISYTWDSEGFFCKECLTYTLRNDHNKNVCRILKGNFV